MAAEQDLKRLSRGAAFLVSPDGNAAQRCADFFDSVQAIAEAQERAGDVTGASSQSPVQSWSWRSLLSPIPRARAEGPEIA
ncbi:MAG: hypothetical protein ACYDDF_06415 [Thermoplasmatota archaeon]